MTGEEIRQAFKAQVPVIHNCHNSGTMIRYKRIKAIKYEIRTDGKLYLSAIMTDDNERCEVTARPEDVKAAENKEQPAAGV